MGKSLTTPFVCVALGVGLAGFSPKIAERVYPNHYDPTMFILHNECAADSRIIEYARRNLITFYPDRQDINRQLIPTLEQSAIDLRNRMSALEQTQDYQDFQRASNAQYRVGIGAILSGTFIFVGSGLWWLKRALNYLDAPFKKLEQDLKQENKKVEGKQLV